MKTKVFTLVLVLLPIFAFCESDRKPKANDWYRVRREFEIYDPVFSFGPLRFKVGERIRAHSLDHLTGFLTLEHYWECREASSWVYHHNRDGAVSRILTDPEICAFMGNTPGVLY